MGISKGIFVGQVQNKVGKVVFRMRDGVNVVSQKPVSVSNPRTSDQMTQRMRFTTAFGNYKVLRDIANHSWENKKYGAKSMAYFMKKCLEYYKGLLITDKGYAQKGNSQVLLGGGYPISEGSLESIGEKFVGTNADIDHPTFLLGNATIAEIINQTPIQKGDQITFGLVKCGGYFADDALLQPKYARLYLARIVIKNDASGDAKLLAPKGGSTTDFIINKDVIVVDKSLNYDDLIFTQIEKADKGEMSWTLASSLNVGKDWYPWAGFAILSRKVGSIWQRSNEIVVGINNVSNAITMGKEVLPTYDPKSSYYLNNAAK